MATYGCEASTFNKAVEKHICAFEYMCYRRVLRISWTEKRTNRSIQKELKIKENWLMLQIRKKSEVFCTYRKDVGLEKTIVEGGIPTKKRRGRPRRRWIQDVTDGLNMTAAKAGHLAYEREKFRRTVGVTKFCSGQAI